MNSNTEITEFALGLLRSVYKDDAVFLTEITDHSTTIKTLNGSFRVGMNEQCTKQPVQYVTSEQHIRCLSQLSFILIAWLITCGEVRFEGYDVDDYRRLMAEYQLAISRLNIKFRKHCKRNEDFELEVRLNLTRKTSSGIVAVISFDGAIQGDARFIGILST